MRPFTLLAPVLALTACSYQPPAAGPGDDDVGVDAPTTDPGTDAPQVELDAPPQVTCTTSDGSLTLCLEFEDAATTIALDGSGRGHDASVANASAVTRDVPELSRALAIQPATTIMIPDSPDFDVQTLTVSAWVQRTGLPQNGQRFGVVDVGRKQAAIAIDGNGDLVCMVRTTAGDTWVGTGGAVPANSWTLTACTYDAPTLCMYTFTSGNPTPTSECGDTDGEPLDTSSPAGGTIGALFDTANTPSSKLAGNVDSIRLYGRALTATQLCTAGGLTGC